MKKRYYSRILLEEKELLWTNKYKILFWVKECEDNKYRTSLSTFFYLKSCNERRP